MTASTPSHRFEQLVFDLDDTLLDTSGLLVPAAARESCEAMISAGLSSDLDQCLRARVELAQTPLRTDLYRQLVAKFGVVGGASPDDVAKRGYDAFHVRDVETNITLFPGARDMLRDLRSRYGLRLLTAGHRGTQESKIAILHLETLFESVHHVDPSRGERKRDGFAEIARLTGAPPNRHLSIGNRLDTDIGEAKSIGFKTCWVRYGEHSHLSPSSDLEIPDYEIRSITELVSRCRL